MPQRCHTHGLEARVTATFVIYPLWGLTPLASVSLTGIGARFCFGHCMLKSPATLDLRLGDGANMWKQLGLLIAACLGMTACQKDATVRPRKTTAELLDHASMGRFALTSDPKIALDSKTGNACKTWDTSEIDALLPLCEDLLLSEALTDHDRSEIRYNAWTKLNNGQVWGLDPAGHLVRLRAIGTNSLDVDGARIERPSGEFMVRRNGTWVDERK